MHLVEACSCTLCCHMAAFCSSFLYYTYFIFSSIVMLAGWLRFFV